jgi:hypothetical protein
MKPNYSFQKRQKELEKKKKKAEKLAKKAAGGDQSSDDPSVDASEDGALDSEPGSSEVNPDQLPLTVATNQEPSPAKP